MTAVPACASAYTIICPRCGVAPYARCRSVAAGKVGYLKRFPHPARVRATL